MIQAHIPFSKLSREFDLSNESIDLASQWLVTNLVKEGVSRSDCLRMRLLLEEALLNIAEHYGAQQTYSATLERWQGRYRLKLVVQGEKFNPLKAERYDDQDDLSISLFSIINLHAHYAYSTGSNVLRLSLSRPTWNPVLKIIIAIFLGVVIGVLGNLLIPPEAKDAISTSVLNPIADMWIRLLQAISAPIIFLTALTATFGMRRIADFGGSQVDTVIRYLTISLIVVLFALICAWPIFPHEISSIADIGKILSNVFKDILSIVPSNLFDPFIQANTPQLLIIAIGMGYLLATMESRSTELKTIINQLNSLGLAVARQICAFVPFFVGLILCLKIWTRDTELLGSIWIPLVVSTVIATIVLLVNILITSVQSHVNPFILMRKLRGPFGEALKRGTLDFSIIDDLANTCKNLLGIDAEFARATLPQGLFLYMPISAIGICVFVLFAARLQQINVDPVWIISAVALSVVMAIATPPITGANLLSFVAVFTYLGISNDAILDVMIFDLVFGVLCIAFDQAMLQLEMVSQAKRMGLLNEDTLRAPMA